jgi:hypothetical protein
LPYPKEWVAGHKMHDQTITSPKLLIVASGASRSSSRPSEASATKTVAAVV